MESGDTFELEKIQFDQKRYESEMQLRERELSLNN